MCKSMETQLVSNHMIFFLNVFQITVKRTEQMNIYSTPTSITDANCPQRNDKWNQILFLHLPGSQKVKYELVFLFTVNLFLSTLALMVAQLITLGSIFC